jgi:hypothetical protein
MAQIKSSIVATGCRPREDKTSYNLTTLSSFRIPTVSAPFSRKLINFIFSPA